MMRVIVADDDRVSSHLLCAILRKHGYAPEPVLDVGTLFAACATVPRPAAILLDLHMPGGSGSDSIRHILATDAMSGVPVIVVSGSADLEEHAESVRLGATAFLAKPVDAALLMATLRGATGRTEPSSE